MNDMFRSKEVKTLIWIISFVVLVLIGWSIYYANFVFHITGTNPSTNSVSAQTPFFKINFSQPISADTVKVSTYPDILLSTEASNKVLTLNIEGMEIDSEYTITLQSVENNKGKKIENQTFKFKARDIVFSKLPKDQQEAILARQDDAPQVNRNPILQYLPHSTLTYNLSAVISSGQGDTGESKVSLQAELLLNGADMKTDKQAAINKYKQQVIDYIKSLDIDPNNYVIDYEVIEPAY